MGVSSRLKRPILMPMLRFALILFEIQNNQGNPRKNQRGCPHGDVLLSEVDVKQSGEYVQNFTRMQIIGTFLNN